VNDVLGTPSTSNSVTTDPVFVNSVGNDFRLYSNSPCVNTGNNSSNSFTYDIRGQARIQNTTIDMGAYEWTSGIDPVYFTWTGSSDNDWNTIGNWNPSGIPGTNDNVAIPEGLIHYPVIPMGGGTCKSIALMEDESSISGSGTLTIADVASISGVADNANISCPLSLPSVSTIDINTGGELTISGIISGAAGSLGKTGNGTLILSGLNTYTGTTNVNAGILRLGIASALATSGPLGTTDAGTVVSSGAVLDIFGYSLTSGATEALTLNGTGISNGGALVNQQAFKGVTASYIGVITLGSASSIGAWHDITLNGNIISSGYNLTKVGNGTLDLGSNITTLNNLTINSGTLKVEAVAATPLTCGSLTIASGAYLTIPAGKALSANGNFINNGTFNINASSLAMGSFIDNGTISGSGTYNVNRWVSTNGMTSGTNRWEYISSPLVPASSDLFASALHSLYYADENSNQWLSYSAGDDHLLTPMQGYTRHYVYDDGDEDGVVTFTGTGILNTEPQSIDLTRNDLAQGAQHGWNLVGNPFPSAIDWLASDGWTKTHITGSFYVRSNGNYGVFTSDGIGTVSTTQYISSMQAFWVRVSPGQTTGILGCTNDVRVHNAQNIYKTKSCSNTLHLTATKHLSGTTSDVIRMEPVSAVYIVKYTTNSQKITKRIFINN
jgi:autotransporter-associated beta strand protein